MGLWFYRIPTGHGICNILGMRAIIAIFALFAISAHADLTKSGISSAYDTQPTAVQQPTQYTEYAQATQLDNSYLAPAAKIEVQQPTQANCRIVGQQVWCETY